MNWSLSTRVIKYETNKVSAVVMIIKVMVEVINEHMDTPN